MRATPAVSSPGRWILLVALVLILFTAGAGSAEADELTGFTDIPEGYVHSPDIARLVDSGIIRGYPDGTFKPTQSVTQHQLDVMLDRVCPATFDDLYGDGDDTQIIQHHGSHRSVPATRDDTAYFAGNWIGTAQIFLDVRPDIVDYGAPNVFPDVSYYHHEAEINSLAREGIITGYDDGTFKPERLVTRAQAAAIIVRSVDWLHAALEESGSVGDPTRYHCARF